MATKTASLISVSALLLGAGTAFADSTPPLVWHLQNRGEKIRLPLENFRSTELPARVGEDVGLFRSESPGSSPALRPVRVAILDTGVDSTHPDLQGRFLESMPASFPRDGWKDTIGHGTHVAGVIAARPGRLGTEGLAPNALLIPLATIRQAPNAPIRTQALSGGAGGLASAVERGLRLALDAGAEVIHLSLAWPSAVSTSNIRALLDEAETRQVLVVASAGNDATQARVEPCSHPAVICVGAHAPDGTRAFFSNHGAAVDLLAPGLAIVSTWPLQARSSTLTEFQGYEQKSGTSMAAPLVSGALARLLGEGFSPVDARARILLGSRGLPAPSEVAPISRRGRLDLSLAHQVRPQPLIELRKRAIREFSIPTESDGLKVELEFQNRWLSASTETEVELSLAPESAHPSDVPARTPADLPPCLTLESTRLRLPALGSLEKTQQTVRIRRNDSESCVAGRWTLTAQSVRSAEAPQSVLSSVELAFSKTIGVGSAENPIGTRELTLRGFLEGLDPERSELRRVTGIGPQGESQGDFLLRIDGTQSLALARLPQIPETSELKVVMDRLPLPENFGRLISLWPVQSGEVALNRRSEIPTLWLLYQEQTSAPGAPASFIFAKVSLSSSGAPAYFVASVRIDPRETALSDQIRFVRATAGTELVPSWVGISKLPASERPAPNPWDPNGEDDTASALRPRVLQVLPTGNGRLASLLSELTSLTPLGISPTGGWALCLENSGRLSWQSLTTNAALPVESPIPLRTESIRAVQTQIDQQGLALILTGARDSLGVLELDAPRDTSPPARYKSLRPRLREGDLALSVLGTAQSGTLLETRFELLAVGPARDTSSVELERFSFLPQGLLARAQTAVLLPLDGSLRPGLWTPEGLGATEAAELTLPSAPGAVRPAALRFRSGEGCFSLASLAPTSSRSSSQNVAPKVLFVCPGADRLLEVPLELSAR